MIKDYRNYWTNNEVIDMLTSIYGSKFAAINYVSKWARYLAAEYGDSILHSSALNWITTGHKPNRLKDVTDRQSYEDMLYADAMDILNYIDDLEIKEAVITSINKSRKYNHLIYVYNDIQDEYKRSRINILIKIIWDVAHIGYMF